jgi:uncharacterized protein YcbX
VRVVELWRYPVKSLQGERLTTAAIGTDGVVGDRRWALVDPGTGFVAVVESIPRCVMVTRPQAGGIGRDTSVLKTVQRERSGDLAVGAQVLMAGTVRTGDVLASG